MKKDKLTEEVLKKCKEGRVMPILTESEEENFNSFLDELIRKAIQLTKQKILRKIKPLVSRIEYIEIKKKLSEEK